MNRRDFSRLLGRHVRRLREDQELTQAVVAARLGREPAMVCKVELGRTMPQADTLYQLVVVGLNLRMSHFWATLEEHLEAKERPPCSPSSQLQLLPGPELS